MPHLASRIVLSLCLVPVFISAPDFAKANPSQENPAGIPPEPAAEVFFSVPTRIRLVAGPWTRLTLIGGSNLAILAGGGGGFVFFDRLLLMGYAYSRASHSAPGDDSRGFTLTAAGGQAAWILSPLKRLHATMGALIGETSATITAKADANDKVRLDYLAIEPFAEVEASLYPGLKLFAGIGYRFLAGKGNRSGIDQDYLRGPTLEFGFRMGN